MLKILIVSHDAGGANILLALAKKYRKSFIWEACLAGPARKAFLNSKTSSFIKIHGLEASKGRILISLKPDLVLAGLSWTSSFENDFLNIARSQGIKTASFLDHWSDYRKRFGYPHEWRGNLPDKFFVGDKYAYNIAVKKGFPKKDLVLVENPYFEDIIRQASAFRERLGLNNSLRILFISEPLFDFVSKHYGNPHFLGYTEFEILKDLLEIKNSCLGFPLELKIRMHPSEKPDKYKGLLKSYSLELNKGIDISDSNITPLVKDCIWSDLVIGADSMAVVIAHLIGKKTIAYLPEAKKLCTLPHCEIKKVYSKSVLAKEIKSFWQHRFWQPPKNTWLLRGRLFKIAVVKTIGNNTAKKKFIQRDACLLS